MAVPTDPGDIATGAVITETYLDRMRNRLIWAAGGWTSFSATLTQSGSISLSTNTCQYVRMGDVIIAKGALAASSAGTGGNVITVGGLPVAASSSGYLVGTAMYKDVSPTPDVFMIGHAFMQTTTSFEIWGTGDLGTVGPPSEALGLAGDGTGSLTVASGDYIWFNITYQAA